jgi:hypothetical protein
VRAIATAHDATVIAHAQPEGGLEIHVDFPLLIGDGHLASPGDDWNAALTNAAADK